MVRSLPAKQETQVRSLDWEDSLEEGMATHSSILAWRIPWTEYSPWGQKESDMTEWLRLSFHLSFRKLRVLGALYQKKRTKTKSISYYTTNWVIQQIYHRLGDLKIRIYFLITVETRSSKAKSWQDWFLLRPLSLPCRWTSSPWVFTQSSLCVCVLILPTYKDTIIMS